MEALRARMTEVGEQNAGDPEIQVGQISLLQRDAETCAIAHTFATFVATCGPNLILSAGNNILGPGSVWSLDVSGLMCEQRHQEADSSPPFCVLRSHHSNFCSPYSSQVIVIILTQAKRLTAV